MGSLLRPFPVRNPVRLLCSAGVSGTADLARLSLVPVRRMIEKEFAGESAALLFAGSSLHADQDARRVGERLATLGRSSASAQRGLACAVEAELMLAGPTSALLA